jgi:hypothetical protein
MHGGHLCGRKASCGGAASTAGVISWPSFRWLFKQSFAISSQAWSISQKLQSFQQEAFMVLQLNSFTHWCGAQVLAQLSLVRPAVLR